jgi:hypothetical protein
MPETIVLTISAIVGAGPKLKESRTLAVDAYDKISIDVADQAKLAVELQPGGGGSIQLLLVKSSVYGADLKYTVNSDTTDRVLDQPHVLIGTGSVGLFGMEPKKLTFDNKTGQDAQIEILIGRDATP